MDRFEARQGSTMTTKVSSPCLLEGFGNAADANSIPFHQHQLKSAERMELASPTRKAAHDVISHELDKMAGSSEQESVLGDDKVNLDEQREEEGDPINRMMKYACRPPSMALTAKESKFVATGRSHSFGGEQHQFMTAVGAGLMGVGQVQNSPSANLSLHSLITRARRGGRRQPPYSANVSPVTGDCTPTSSCGRPLVKLDASNHQDITQVIAQLTKSEGFQGVQSPTEDKETQDNTRPSCQRPKRISSSSSIAAGFESACPVTPLNKRSRKLIPVECDDGSNASPSSCSLPQDQISLLRLPDPSTISNRRDLFAMSRKMCSRSSIESFGSQAPVSGSSPAGQERPSARRSSCPAEIGLSSHTMDSGKHHREVIKGAISEDAAEQEESVCPGGDSLASTATATAEDLSDEQSFASTASLCSLLTTPLQTRTSSSAPEGPQSKHDEESIAFSMDSVHVRKNQIDSSQHKKQIDSSQHTRFNRSNRQQAFRTDWAGDSLHETTCSHDIVDDEASYTHRPRHVTSNRDRQQSRAAQRIVVCEFDLDAMLKGSFSQGAFPVRSQPRGVDRYEPEDDECSFGSVSSLGTIVSGQVLHMDFME